VESLGKVTAAPSFCAGQDTNLFVSQTTLIYRYSVVQNCLEKEDLLYYYHSSIFTAMLLELRKILMNVMCTRVLNLNRTTPTGNDFFRKQILAA